MKSHLMRRLAPLAAALCLLLAACGGGDSSPKPYDPAAVSKALLESKAFSEPLDQMDRSLVCGALYAIDDASVTDCAVYTTLTAGAEELAVLTLKDENAAAKALDALRQRVSQQKEALASYQPEEVAKLDNAILEQRGVSVLLVVPGDSAAAKDALAAFN